MLQAATVTQGCATVEVCEAVLLTGSNGNNAGKEQEAVDGKRRGGGRGVKREGERNRQKKDGKGRRKKTKYAMLDVD
eukprot:evm.model.NODE_29968_length_14959_cov_43.438801.2